MSRELRVILGGLAALTMLASISLVTVGPRIEQHLRGVVNIALTQAGIDFAGIEVRGRNVLLTGVAPTVVEKYRAEQVASKFPGVFKLDSAIEVAEPAPPPYVLVTFSGEELGLKGNVREESLRHHIVQTLQQQFQQARVEDGLEVSSAVPEEWEDLVTGALGVLNALDAGAFSLKDDTFNVIGTTDSDELREATRLSLEDLLPDGYRLAFDVAVVDDIGKLPDDVVAELEALEAEPDSYSQSRPVEATTLSDASSACQTGFDTALAQGQVLFDRGSAALKTESMETLDNMIAIAELCPRSGVEVAGHTDASGSAKLNQVLSLARARAVVDYFEANGISPAQLHAIGFGEMRPIADNDTAVGRARNRRIEFVLIDRDED